MSYFKKLGFVLRRLSTLSTSRVLDINTPTFARDGGWCADVAWETVAMEAAGKVGTRGVQPARLCRTLVHIHT